MQVPAAGAAIFLVVLAAVAPARAAQLGNEVLPLVAASGTTEVLVMLRPPSPTGSGLAQRRRAVGERQARVLAAMPPGVRLHEQLSLISAFSAEVDAGGLRALLDHPDVLRVDAMRYGSGALAQSVAQIGAAAVHRRDDLGAGVTVAVLDTGVQETHPDLAGSIVAEECFCSGNCCPNGSSRQSGRGSAFTTFGHGIHVTGILVSKGVVAAPGVAPAAKVVAVKVLSDQNRGSLLDWIRGLDWLGATRPDVQVINMSLVSKAVFRGYCDTANAFNMAFAQIIGLLRTRGVLTVVAAGNGARTDALAAPACVRAAVAVGAVDRQDTVATFSDVDPALDVLAPGVGIVSTGIDGSAATLTGTSMATAHVTGTAALLLAINPTLGADELESVLKETGLPVFDPRVGRWVPRVNALAAMNAVWRMTAPLPGGGSKRTDCLVEWNLTAPDIAVSGPVAGAGCRDNDPSCDADQTSGQCTLVLSLCFNVSDRRLPRCSTAAPITEVRFTSLGAAHPALTFAVPDGPPLASVLPELPITGTDVCTPEVAFVVARGGSRWIRVSAHAADGRNDHDRLRLVCQ